MKDSRSLRGRKKDCNSSARSAHFLRRPYENVSAESIRPIAKRLEWPDAVTVLPKAELLQRIAAAAISGQQQKGSPPGLPPRFILDYFTTSLTLAFLPTLLLR